MTRGILAAAMSADPPGHPGRLDAMTRPTPEPFVDVVAEPPATKQVLGSNHVRVHVRADERTGRVLAIGVEDNLVKGAAGQAIQAFNLVFGLPETAGLEQLPLAP
jgi:N-acetyl-gamma-glutamyl-phosphate reductase